MKTERRHDLETNELAVKLNDGIDYIKPHMNKVLIGLAVVVGLMAINSIIRSESVVKQERAWDEFAKAKSATDQERLAMQQLAFSEDYVGTKMQEWAQLSYADHQVLIASQYYFRDREGSLERLKSVKGLYEGLSQNASDRETQDRAHYGLARVYELQNKPDLARSEYALVQGTMQPLASERAEKLMDDSVKADVEWLAKAEFPKFNPNAGLGERPDFDVDIPNASSNKSSQDSSSLNDLLKNFEIDTSDEDRYQEDSEEESDSEVTSDEDGETKEE